MNASTLRAKFFYADSAASQRHPRQTDVELLQALKEHADPAVRLVIDRHGSAVVGLAVGLLRRLPVPRNRGDPWIAGRYRQNADS